MLQPAAFFKLCPPSGEAYNRMVSIVSLLPFYYPNPIFSIIFVFDEQTSIIGNRTYSWRQNIIQKNKYFLFFQLN